MVEMTITKKKVTQTKTVHNDDIPTMIQAPSQPVSSQSSSSSSSSLSSSSSSSLSLSLCSRRSPFFLLLVATLACSFVIVSMIFVHGHININGNINGNINMDTKTNDNGVYTRTTYRDVEASLQTYMDAPKKKKNKNKQPPPQQQLGMRVTTRPRQRRRKHEIPKGNGTKILGFADFGYKEIAVRWYRELEKLGYNEHILAAQDTIAGEYFQSHDGMRYDLVYDEGLDDDNSNSNSNSNNNNNNNNKTGLRDECDFVYNRLENDNKRKQMYRRSLFGSRWHHMLRYLEAGYNVLLTDVDNVYAQYKPMSEMEDDSEYDIFHAYAGTVPSFPLNLFRLMGFTVCGGMSWLRSTPAVIDFVKDIVKQCGCTRLHCTCFCDDQVVLNKYVYFNYIWDDHHNITVPTSMEELTWGGLTGRNNITGHRVKIWDRDVAYRAEFDETACPDKSRNWIAMPTGLDREQTWDIWREKCLNRKVEDDVKVDNKRMNNDGDGGRGGSGATVAPIENGAATTITSTTTTNNHNNNDNQSATLIESEVAPKSRSTAPESNTPGRKEDKDIGTNTTTTATTTTKIIGFADTNYKEIAHRWYTELEHLGYTEHMVAAQDGVAAEYFRSHNIRHDLVYRNANKKKNFTSLYEACDEVMSAAVKSEAKRKQYYRHSLFGSRWNYVLKQLEAGYHVLLTDVDNVYTQYKPLSDMELSDYDVFHAYAGTFPSYPLNLFSKMGFTVCGGMSWLRSTPSVIAFVREITKSCKCEALTCTCFCDDQVNLNTFLLNECTFWDPRHPDGSTIKAATSLEDLNWEGYAGYCNKTGHRIKIWDRDVAYRAEIGQKCPDPDRNWISMPIGLDRTKMWEGWREACPLNETSGVAVPTVVK